MKPHANGYPIKLVRDGTPDILNASREPGDLWYEFECSDRERWLKLKLAEEVGEYLVDGGTKELADVLAVVEALTVEHGIDLPTLTEMMCADERGGFFQGVLMYGRHPEYDGDGHR